MSNQTAKFGVLVQRGKEQYVIEGKEHPVPPELVPPPPTPGWYCSRANRKYDYVRIWCWLAEGGSQECAGRFYDLCERGDPSNSSTYIINLGVNPIGEDPKKIKLGEWQLDYTWDDSGRVYSNPDKFDWLAEVKGDVNKFKYYRDTTGSSGINPNETFHSRVWWDALWVEFNPSSVEIGNYTIQVRMKFKPLPEECNCTFTILLPYFGFPNWWTVHASCIDRMLEPAKSYDFGSVNIYESKDANFTIKNNINTTLLADVWIDGPDYLDFEIIEGPKGKFYLWPSNHTNIKIRWNPQVLGNQTAKLNLSCDNGYWDYCYLIGLSEKPTNCEQIRFLRETSPHHWDTIEEHSFGELLIGETAEEKFGVMTISGSLSVNLKLEGDDCFRITDGGGVAKLSQSPHYITIKFSPSAPGNFTGYLLAYPCNASLLLYGKGKSFVLFEPWHYDFGSIQLKHCSDSVPFSLKNIGEENAEVSVSVQGDENSNFTLIKGFNGTLYAGSEETVRVRFCPNQFGNATAYLCAEVTASADEYINITAVLYGKGTFQYAEPHISISPADVVFPDTYPGLSSRKSVTIKNEGAEEAEVELSISPEETFDIESKDATISISAGATKKLDVYFKPLVEGNHTGQITANCLNGNIATAIVHGTAPPPPCGDLKIIPSEFDFGDVRRNGCSDTINFTIKNDAAIVFNFTLSLSGENKNDFQILEGEGDQALSPGDYINTKIQFYPKSLPGKKEALLTIQPYAPICGNISAKLTGICLPNCYFDLDRDAHNFGEVLLNECTETVFTVTNTGLDSCFYTAFIDAFDEKSKKSFMIISGSNATLAPSEANEIKIKYCPYSEGNHTAFLIVQTPDKYGDYATLHGTGRVPYPGFVIEPEKCDFGSVKITECSSSKEFILRNVGEGPGTISANITGPDASNFLLVSQSGKRTMLPGCFHKFKVKFCPDEPRNFTAKLWINTSYSLGEVPDVYADLIGGGLSPYNATLYPDPLDFGQILIGEWSEPLTAYLINTGEANMTVNVWIWAAPSANFTIIQGGGYHYLETNSTLHIKVKFLPQTAERYYSILKAEWPYDSAEALLIGEGREQCDIRITPSDYDFGKVYIGETSESKTFIIENKGKGDTKLDIEIDGVDAENWTAGAQPLSDINLKAGEKINLDIRFAPVTVGKKSAYLVVSPDACAHTWIKLSGEGIEGPPCPLKAYPSSIDFGAVGVHDYSDNATIYIFNEDQISAVLQVAMEGPDKQDFRMEYLSMIIPSNTTRHFLCRFHPSSPGKKIGWYDIKSNNCTVGVVVFLQGEGLPLDSGSPDWDPDPPTTTPIKNRWQFMAAVKEDIPPGYGFVFAHSPNTVWFNYPEWPAYIYYLDPKGCLWARGYHGEFCIYNLHNGSRTTSDLGGGSRPVFALGNLGANENAMKICYWLEPNFIVFGESSWNGNVWNAPEEITRWTTTSGTVNMIYWLPPNFLFLIEGDDNRLELWNENEGIVKSISLDFPPHYATRDKNGRIWISGRDTNKLISFNTELEDEDIEIYSSSRKFAGIGSSSQYDIVVIDKANEELIIRLAEESYAKSYKVSVPGVQEGCSRWEGGYCLFTTNNDALLGIHLRDAALEDGDRRITLGAFPRNVNLRGDAGLLMYSEWGWRWQPDTSVLNIKYIGLL